MKTSKPKVITILGPTASGKTSLAVAFSKVFNGEIISADSRQVYIGLNLGSGKEGEKVTIDLPNLGPTPARLIDGIPQYLIDIISPHETYTVADFQVQAKQLIENITSRGKVPFIVGGTHFYVQALSQNYSLPTSDNKEITIREKLEKLPTADLLEQLKTADPKSYQSIDHKNLRRIIRALSVSLASGQPFSEQQKTANSDYDFLHLAIDLPRGELYHNIDKRVDDRLALGMIDEVKGLLDGGISPEKLISFGLEYRFITEFLTGQILTEAEMAEKLKFATHAYARRQLTWLNNKMTVTWIKDKDKATGAIQQFLS